MATQYQNGIAGHYEAQDIPDEYGFSTGNTRQVFVPDELGSYQRQDILDEYGFPTGNTKQVFVPQNPTAVGAPPLKADARTISTLTPVMSNVAGNQDLSPTIEGYTGVFKDASGDNILGYYDSNGNLVSTMKQVGGTQYNYSPSGKLLSQENVGGEGGLFGGIKSLVTSGAVKAIAPMALPYFGETIAAALSVSSAVGNAIAQTAVQVAQGVPLDKALMNVAISTVVQTGSTDIAKEIVKAGNDPAIANAITSVGGSIVQTAAKGGDSSNILQNAIGALVGSGVTSLTANELEQAASRALGATVGTAAAGGDLEKSLTAGIGSLSKTGTTSTSGATADTTPLTADERAQIEQNRIDKAVTAAQTSAEQSQPAIDAQTQTLLNQIQAETGAATQPAQVATTDTGTTAVNPVVTNEVKTEEQKVLDLVKQDMGTGGAAADTVTGGSVTDTVVGGAGTDTVAGGTAVDTIVGSSGADTLSGGTNVDTVAGGASTGTSATALDPAAVTAAATPKFDTAEFINAVNSGAGQEFINANNLTLADIENQTGFSQGQIDYYGLRGADYVAPAEVAGTDTVTGATVADTVAGGAGLDTVPGGTAETDNVVIKADAPATNVSTADQQIIDLIKTGTTTPATTAVTPAEVITPAVTTPAVTTPAATTPTTTETPATKEEVVVTADKPAVSTIDQQIIDLINTQATANTAATTTPATTATTETTPETTAITTPVTTAGTTDTVTVTDKPVETDSNVSPTIVDTSLTPLITGGTSLANTAVTTPETVTIRADGTNTANTDAQIIDLISGGTGVTTADTGAATTGTTGATGTDAGTVTVTAGTDNAASNVTDPLIVSNVDTSTTTPVTTPSTATTDTKPEVVVTGTTDNNAAGNVTPTIVDTSSKSLIDTTTSLANAAGQGADTVTVTADKPASNVSTGDQQIIDLISGDTSKTVDTGTALPDAGTVNVTAGRENVAAPTIIDVVAPPTPAPAPAPAPVDKTEEVVVTAKKDNVAPTIIDTVTEPAVSKTETAPAEKTAPVEEEVAKDTVPYKPELFIFGGTAPKGRKSSSLSQTINAPFYPSTGLTQALTASRPAGEIEADPSGKKRQNVWNEASLRLKDALGL